MYVMPDGVLCADVAARPAVPAIPAAVLHHAGNVRSRDYGRSSSDGNCTERPDASAALRMPANLAKRSGSGAGATPSMCSARASPSSSSPSLTTASGQPALRNLSKIGPQHDTGVDQRPAAEAGCAEHGQPLADRQVVEPGRIAQLRRASRQPCCLAPRLGRSRKIAGPPKPALLEDRHAQAHACEAGCCDAAAVARADDDRIVDRHRFADGLVAKTMKRSIRPKILLTARNGCHEADEDRCKGNCLMLRDFSCGNRSRGAVWQGVPSLRPAGAGIVLATSNRPSVSTRNPCRPASCATAGTGRLRYRPIDRSPLI